MSIDCGYEGEKYHRPGFDPDCMKCQDAADMVNHPPHYRHPSGIECIAMTRYMTFDGGNATKYVFRAESKNGREDYDKARWYLEDARKHALGFWLSYAPVESWELAHVVADAESDPNRAGFFHSVYRRDTLSALGYVWRLLDKE